MRNDVRHEGVPIRPFSRAGVHVRGGGHTSEGRSGAFSAAVHINI
jgi:hypothetical protein